MEVKINKDDKQVLLDRRTITGTVFFPEKSIPSRKDLRDELAKELKADAGLIVIKKIDSIFGSTKAEFEAHVYEKEDVKNKLEPKYILKRNSFEAKEEKAEG